MALISKQKYDPAQVQKLADLVRLYRDREQPFDYEIIVDGLKVVRRTSDPEMFFIFENFVTADTKNVEIIFYNGNSNVNEKRMFTFIDDEPEKGLSGVEVEARIEEKVRKEMEYDQLKRDNKDLTNKVEELKKEVEDLERVNEELVNSQSPLKGFLGEIGSSFVESFIRRNPNVIKGLPGGEALAGLIETDNKRKEHEEQAPEHEVNFKPKSESNSLTEDERNAITFVNQLKTQFQREEFDKVLLILQTLADDKSKIDLILNHVNIKQ
jgi:FtsZ-binding cell division protein ZapB